MFPYFCFSLLSVICISGEPVKSIPGWTDPLRSDWYSGYLEGSSPSRQLAYVFVESENDPANSPVVYWANGGPGCSSFIGFWLEQGPLRMGGDGTLSENIGRWNKNTNVLFLESPPGVGFSYVQGGAPPYAANDTSTAADNVAALENFFALFPAFGGSPLWLAGESYAGVYVPWTARAVLNNGSAALAARLRRGGILVGNGALHTDGTYESLLAEQRMAHAHGHGLFSSALRAQIDAACTSYTNRSAACNALLEQYPAEMGPLNNYNIQDTCLGSGVGAQQAALLRAEGSSPALLARAEAGLASLRENICTEFDDAVTSYMNLSSVVSAFHFEAGSAVQGAWKECAGRDTLVYTIIPDNEMTDVYPVLLQSMRVLVYNGDNDECIPYGHDEKWTSDMGYPVKEPWRPWLLDNQVAGYVTEFGGTGGGRFTFATVKMAGHEVPFYQPARALALFERFIAGQPL
jgi:serine carboxypeptidase-like clade 1